MSDRTDCSACVRRQIKNNTSHIYSPDRVLTHTLPHPRRRFTMGSGASMYKTPEEALAAGVSQADIDKFLKENPNALKAPENAVQTSDGPVGPSTLADDLTGK